ncbi:hypothetical protein LCM02_05105 [Lutimonas saemankumensis]|uniref:hypothetical protein n=1 Tax=Lutimonas saemankumensis TaxID=483016 RepID=UPI001CD1AF3C|nr:hypothetical protein [Lutimonas saemankumensis]MCA0931821.1 hypothetical protein [Lutimonas saemankumensis]
MIRKIVDYQKLNEDILNLLIEKFPYGYGNDDFITFQNAKGEVIEAVEVRTEDTIYLVKVGVKLIRAMEDFVEEVDSINDEEKDNIDIDSLDNDDLDEL